MVMRKTIKKARTMQTESNCTFHSMKNSSLNFRKLTNGTAFSEIYEFEGRFPFDQNVNFWKFPWSNGTDSSGVKNGVYLGVRTCELFFVL